VDSNTESKNVVNNFKYTLNSKSLKRNNLGQDSLRDTNSFNDFVVSGDLKNFSVNLVNKDLSYRFMDLKPAGSTLLASERTPRLLNSLNPTKLNSNFSLSDNNLNALISESLNTNNTLTQESLFNNSTNN